jgi:hypothetical protein
MIDYIIYKSDSIRLKNYDYSQSGYYFITMCTQSRECLFGHVDDDLMISNNAGKMLGEWYFEMENKYSKMYCDEFIIMSNHFHCIIQIIGNRPISIDNPDVHDLEWIIVNENPDAHDRERIIANENPDAHDWERIIANENPDAYVGVHSRKNMKKWNRVGVHSR